MNFNQKEIVQGVTLLGVNADHFKTNEIAVSLALPLKKETASVNALLINLLSRRSKDYPNLSSLNKRLAFLYGASLSAVVSKVGESQVLKLGITSLDDKFSLDADSISLECTQALARTASVPGSPSPINIISNPMAAGLLSSEPFRSEMRSADFSLDQDENVPYSLNVFSSTAMMRILLSVPAGV